MAASRGGRPGAARRAATEPFRALGLFAVRRADIEGFARDLEARGRARATVTRRLSTIAGSCRYSFEEELLERSPAAHVRRPRVGGSRRWLDSPVAAKNGAFSAPLAVRTARAGGTGSPGVAGRP